MASSLGIWYASWGYVGATIFLAVLSTVAVALRFWSRRISGFGIHADDWLALATLVVHHGIGATILVAFLAYGLGFNWQELVEKDARAATELQKLIFIANILYGVGSTSIRLSAILFYFRIFPTKLVRRGGYIIATVCILWFLTTEILTLTMCKPIAFAWDWEIQGGKCLTSLTGIIVPGAFNVIIDVVTVALPVREVMKLKLSREKRIAVSGIFLIGGIATAASVARLVAITLYNMEIPRVTGSTSALLLVTTGFEIYIALVGACAPTLVPVYKKLRRKPTASDTPIPHRSGYTGKPPKKPSSHAYVMGSTNPALSRTALRESDDEERPFKRLDDIHVLVPPKERGDFWTDISARPASGGIPMEGIRVQRDVTWNSES